MRVWFAIGTLLVPAVGCSATVVDDEQAAAGREAATQGNVTVERSVVLSGASLPEVRTRVSARFVQVSGGFDHETAERVVGSPRVLPATDACERLSNPSWEPLPADAADGAIELLDVGEVLVHAGASTMPLAARAFPDVGEIVSGVVYTSRGATTELPAGIPYLIETSGSHFADGFSVSVDAPLALLQLRVGEHDLDSEETAVVAGEPLSLEWQPGDSTSDQIYVDLTPVLEAGRDQPLATVRCTFADDGAAHVGERFTSWPEEPAEIELAIHRLRRAVLKVPEIDEAVVEFDFALLARLPVADAQ